MKDDYLWDGSGEPDPDVEELEKLLGGYRYQARPLDVRFEQPLSARRPFFWAGYAAAAAVILMALAGAWLLLPGSLSPGDLQAIAETPELTPLPGEGLLDSPVPNTNSPAISVSSPTSSGQRSTAPAHVRRQKPRPEQNGVEHAPMPTVPEAAELAATSPIVNPFVDAETARHIERAQVLLRSFRNTEGGAGFDLTYERQSARRLLAKNVLLRRAAEAKGNLPVEDVLGSLEPFLLDIANLADAPATDDVRVIKARMEKKEIITALQVYSAPTLSRAF